MKRIIKHILLAIFCFGVIILGFYLESEVGCWSLDMDNSLERMGCFPIISLTFFTLAILGYIYNFIYIERKTNIRKTKAKEENKMKEKKSRKIWGIPVVALIIGVLFVGGVSAAVLTYFGQITTTVEVSRAITLDGAGCVDNICAGALSMSGGETDHTEEYTATSHTSVDVPVEVSSIGDAGLTTEVEYNLHAEGTNPREKRIRVLAADIAGLTDLNSLVSIEFEQYVSGGYIGHVDVILEDKALVFEYAKVQAPCDNTPYPTGDISTFGNKGIVNDDAYAWISSGPPGPCGDATFDAGHNTLAEWKGSDGTQQIVALEFEVDSWIATSTDDISDIKVNGNAVDTVIIQAGNDVVFDLAVTADAGLETGVYTVTTEVLV